MAQPLPPNPFTINSSTDMDKRYLAYNEALELERGSPNRSDVQIQARVLGYLLIYLDEQAQLEVGRNIKDCFSQSLQLELAQFYVDILIRAYKTPRPTPAISEHLSRPPIDDLHEYCGAVVDFAPNSHTTSKIKALIRDGYRCVLTGIIDEHSEDRHLIESPTNARIGETKISHVVPQSVFQRFEKGDVKHKYAAGVAAALTRSGSMLYADELNGEKVHRLENVMTMEFSLHRRFDQLKLWLEATGNPNEYNVRTLRAEQFHLFSAIKNPITLVSHDGSPLPDPKYLKLHAACARVAHLSGAGEYVEKILRDIETTNVLSEDGSSFTLLNSALRTATVRG